MENERVMLSVEEVDKLLEPGDQVHTFKQGGMALIGCDWGRDEILRAAGKYGAELAGAQAAAMKHGVVVYDGSGGPVFCATRRD